MFNYALLGAIGEAMQNSESPFLMVNLADAEFLVTNGVGETNPAAVADGKIATRLTDKGLTELFAYQNLNASATPWASNPAAAPNAPAPNVPFTVVSVEDIEWPVAKNKKASAGTRSRTSYPVDKLEIGQVLFVPATEDRPKPSRNIASLASRIKKIAKENGTTVPNFTVKTFKDGAIFGEQFAGVGGAAIRRDADLTE